MKKVLFAALFLFMGILCTSFSQTQNNTAGNDFLMSYSAPDSVRSIPQKRAPAPEVIPDQKGGTLAGEFAGGVAAGVAGGLIGGFAGGLAASSIYDSRRQSDDGIYAFIMIGSILGYDLAASGAVTLIGNTGAVKGDFGSAFLGSILGSGVGVVLLYVAVSTSSYGNDGILPTLSVITLFSAPVVGAMIGFSESRHWDKGYYKYHSENLIDKQARYSSTLAQRLSVEGLSVSVRQNPYKVLPEPVTYLGVVRISF